MGVGHGGRGVETAQEEEMIWNSSYSNQERRLCQALLYPILLLFPGEGLDGKRLGRGRSGTELP